jgi:FlaA1/EpsC-like NDP-sugar epimerase
MINIDGFIKKHITFREDSFFKDDLLKYHDALTDAIHGKSVLVVGGAGTIGSSYIKAVLRYNPSRLFVADTSENGLTELTRDLRSSYGTKVPDDYKTYPVSFHDPVFGRILEQEGPFDIIANFAAHKHVRSEKDHYSITALLENNVIRAEQLLQRILKQPPAHFFCVSTDKAANPVNIMGASKKLMEEMIMAYANRYPVTTARFANVAFSNGSLPDGFISRVMKRQPLSSPSDVKRYFVSPEESGEICMLACMLGNTGEIFFPKLGEDQMLTFSDIAIKFLDMLGYEPLICASEEEARRKATEMTDNTKQYPVYFFTSDTSGEKAYEEFYTQGEDVDMDSFHALGVIKNAPRKDLAEIHMMIASLKDVLGKPMLTKADIVRVLGDYLPSFQHLETGKNLDQKM